ncbi:MAG: helix-turn-helix transcriptional regulator [Treponema sp.]|jgi:transcriptional regulator with XRE-family HTH domain|nr:helix-turn-helix transcriptional regulator [Treponema sp.]
MTHFQELFIKNLRFFRKKEGISQLIFSEMIGISPNYLNAVENGKNFPSPEVIQTILDVLDIQPYQLFLEKPIGSGLDVNQKSEIIVQELMGVREKLINEIDNIIKKYDHI